MGAQDQVSFLPEYGSSPSSPELKSMNPIFLFSNTWFLPSQYQCSLSNVS